MSERGGMHWLRRLGDMPNDHPVKALAVALGVAVVCALVVSTAAVLLEPYQRANKERDRLGRIGEIVARLPGAATIRTELVELSTGETVTGIDPATYDQREAAADPEQSVEIPAGQDLARIKRRARYAPVTLVESAGRIELIILPVHGAGYGGTIYGFLALRGDGNTVAALSIFEHDETPGLGAGITSPGWLAQWPGKSVHDAAGEVRIGVARGAVDPGSGAAAHEVDGISGATRTGQGVTNLLRFWLGPQGFGPYLERIAR